MSSLIRVEGFGVVKATPDMMRFSYELVQVGDSYSDSHTKLVENYATIVEAFKKVMFNTALIKTSSINVAIIHPTENKPKQFQSSQSLVFEDKIDLKRMNDLLDVLRSSTDFNFSLSYFLKDTSNVDNDAITLAVNDATDKAKVIASASGIKLGAIKSIEFTSQHADVYPKMRAMSMDLSGGMNASDLMISKSVVISWDIK